MSRKRHPAKSKAKRATSVGGMLKGRRSDKIMPTPPPRQTYSNRLSSSSYSFGSGRRDYW